MRMTRLFARYLVSFVLVFFIPFAALGFFIDRYLFNEILERERETQYQDIVRNAAILDQRLVELDQLWMQISSDSDFRPFSFEENPFRAYRLIKELRKYTYTNNFIESLYILYREHAYIYSANNAQSLAFFWQTHFDRASGSQTTTKAELTEVLYNSRDKQILEHDGRVYITIPFPYGFRTPTGTIVLEISSETIAHYIATKGLDAYQIESRDGTILVRSGPAELHNPIEYRSQASGLSYRAVLSERMVASEVGPIRLMFGYSMIGVLVVGLLSITGASLMSYSPIRKLLRIFERPNDASDVGELEFIRARYEEVLTEEKTLREQMEHELPMLREAVIARLLNGTLERQETLQEVGLEFNDECYCIAVVDFGGPLPSCARVPIERLQELRPEASGINAFCMADITMTRLAIVVGTASSSPAAIHRFLQTAHRFWNESEVPSFTVAVSSTKTGIATSGEAYMEAIEALSYRIARRANALILYDDIREGRSGAAYPYEEVQALYRAVGSGNAQQVSVSLEKIIERIESEGLKIEHIRRLYFNVMNSIASAFRERGRPDRDELPLTDVFTIERIGSRDEMISLLRETAQRVRETLHTDEGKKPQYIEELQSFLDDHYDDPSLSLQGLADRFHLTPPHLSTTFKRHTGKNISEHISTLRLEKAADLLCCSDMPIKAIVSAAGYTDSSSFIRKFKSRYGVTPGEYRRTRPGREPNMAEDVSSGSTATE